MKECYVFRVYVCMYVYIFFWHARKPKRLIVKYFYVIGWIFVLGVRVTGYIEMKKKQSKNKCTQSVFLIIQYFLSFFNQDKVYLDKIKIMKIFLIKKCS